MKRILVVDDEPELRRIFAEVLSDEGYAVTLAGDGRAALDRAAAERPDLVLMDVMMPRLDGRQARQAMRERPDLRPIPVVLMSAGAGDARFDPTLEGFLPKPFDLNDLLDLVHRLIGPAG